MKDRRFLDTNVLVYAYDREDPAKQAVAQRVLEEGIVEERLTISVQVLGEFFNVVTRRIKPRMSPDEATGAVMALCALPVIDIDLSMVKVAIDTHRRHGISYWDSLIVAAAERAGCQQILSEDLNEGQAYLGATVVNPFRNMAAF